MKKILVLLLVLFGAWSFAACSSQDDISEETIETSETTVLEETVPTSTPTPTPIPESMLPNKLKICSMCKLATERVYFHDVAKATKPKNDGASGWLMEDRQYWIEYSGYVDLGIDLSESQIEIEGNKVIVTLPEAGIIGDVNIDSTSYSNDKVIVEPSKWYKTENVIGAADVAKSIGDANLKTKTEILNNKSLTEDAKVRAQIMIKNYIDGLSKFAGISYEVEFRESKIEVQ